jgi:hypothetical protein
MPRDREGLAIVMLAKLPRVYALAAFDRLLDLFVQ